ncbi:MAG TPA: Xaa-Pro peptidase family protein [Gaiellaceae bacterium]|nr:Xaa-Pro peptidase family protein [Gaiellaceae bacterium]
MTPRVERLRALLEEPLLVTNGTNVRYLTGFVSSNAAVLVEPDRVQLFSDFRYAEQGRRVEDVEFVEVGRNLLAQLAERLSGRIGFEAGALTYAAYETLRGGGLDLVPRHGLVEQLRAVKDESEVEAIRRSTAITNRAFARLAQERFSGRTERELAWTMERLLREEGADSVAFPVIVAAGPTGASPHTEPGDRRVEPGDTVVVDAGARVAGYQSDCTRTFAVGALDGRLEEAYAVCLRAQLEALDGVRAGVRGAEVDAVARTIVDGTGFQGLFGHGLGHGLGLDVHEAPTMRPESEDVLADGNVVSVEPGIYLPGEGGIRIEDLVVVREGGCEVLTDFPKEPTTVE